MDHVERLTRGKRSGANIGSRAVGHQLRAFEREIYERALKARYLTVAEGSRDNLMNIWRKVALIKEWACLVLVKRPELEQGEIFQDDEPIFTGDLPAAKTEVRRLANALNV